MATEIITSLLLYLATVVIYFIAVVNENKHPHRQRIKQDLILALVLAAGILAMSLLIEFVLQGSSHATLSFFK